MTDDLTICNLTADLYEYRPGATNTFDQLVWPEADDGVCYAIKRLPDSDLVIFRGSVTPQDWARDFKALPKMEIVNHKELGFVHAGFMEGLEDAYCKIVPALRGGFTPTVVAGHSLGAARATLFAGLLAARGERDVGRVVFGEPNSCGPSAAGFINSVLYRNASYRCCWKGEHDTVTDVPFWPFKCPTPRRDVYAEPAANDPWGPFKLHHIQLYQAGIASQGGVK